MRFLFPVFAVAAVALLTTAARAQSQAPVPAPDAGFGYGANILVPSSHRPAKGGSPKTRYTQYLFNAGPWNRTSLDSVRRPAVASIQGYHPSDLQSAYNVPATGGAYAIAIVDADNDPYVQQDFNTFSSAFGLPQETSTNVTANTNEVLQVVYAAGVQPPSDRGWAGEISLDVQWAHAMAPNAKIYLVEASGASDAALDQAVLVAASLPNVKEISMSYGSSSEYAGEQSEDSYYAQPGIVYFSATGDTAAVRGYPAMSPNVVGVGGNTVNIVGGVVSSERVWADTGCGDSIYVPRPAFQSSVASIVGQFRGSPDLSADADPNTGVAIYDTYESGWKIVGGTSLACPLCAAITNDRLNYSSSSAAELTRLYGQIGGAFLRDITSGSVTDPTTNEVYKAAAGYDLASGLGEPIGLYAPQTRNMVSASILANSVGRYMGGSLSNLAAVDGNDYTLASLYSTGAGEVASVDLQYQVNLATGSAVGAAQLGVTATTIYGTTVEVFALNLTTGAYDDLGPVPTNVAASDGWVGVDPKYFAANGTVSLRIRATRPIRYGLMPFVFRLDRALVEAIVTS